MGEIVGIFSGEAQYIMLTISLTVFGLFLANLKDRTLKVGSLVKVFILVLTLIAFSESRIILQRFLPEGRMLIVCLDIAVLSILFSIAVLLFIYHLKLCTTKIPAALVESAKKP